MQPIISQCNIINGTNRDQSLPIVINENKQMHTINFVKDSYS